MTFSMLMVYSTIFGMIFMNVVFSWIYWRRVFWKADIETTDIYDEKADRTFMSRRERLFNAAFITGICWASCIISIWVFRVYGVI